MALNNGFFNEDEFLEYMNGKFFDDISYNLQQFILFLTNGIIPNNRIICYKVAGPQKPDVVLVLNEKEYNISLKCGSGNSVHQEPLELFISFLKQINFPENGINLLKHFHYGDDTYDDTGKHRYSSREYIERYPKNITMLNTLLNNPLYSRQILERVLFQGKNPLNKRAEFLYHGTINQGIWANSNELLAHPHTINNNCVHVSFLTYQPWNRDNNFNNAHPDRRYVVQFKFGSCVRVLSEIRR